MSNLDLARAVFRKSSRSEGGNGCVEAATLDGRYLVRDSKNPAGGTLVVDFSTWLTFVSRIKGGGYDL